LSEDERLQELFEQYLAGWNRRLSRGDAEARRTALDLRDSAAPVKTIYTLTSNTDGGIEERSL
jgi:hypothetical protein